MRTPDYGLYTDGITDYEDRDDGSSDDTDYDDGDDRLDDDDDD